jgi:hypothetical protein
LTTLVKEQRTRRIAVLFGGGTSDASVASVLPSLLQESSTDITGLFLEDLRILRLAELPFTTELCRVSMVRRPLTIGELERQMRVQALRAETIVRRIAEQAGLPWSFRKHRGRLGTVLAEARDVDLLLLGAARFAVASAEFRAPTRRAESKRPIAVLFDEAGSGQRAVAAGIELAKKTGRGLIVFLAAEEAESPADLGRRIRESMGPEQGIVQIVVSTPPDAVLAAVRRAAPSLLIVGADEAGFEESRLAALQRELRCPTLVVR